MAVASCCRLRDVNQRCCGARAWQRRVVAPSIRRASSASRRHHFVIAMVSRCFPALPCLSERCNCRRYSRTVHVITHPYSPRGSFFKAALWHYKLLKRRRYSGVGQSGAAYTSAGTSRALHFSTQHQIFLILLIKSSMRQGGPVYPSCRANILRFLLTPLPFVRVLGEGLPILTSFEKRRYQARQRVCKKSSNGSLDNNTTWQLQPQSALLYKLPVEVRLQIYAYCAPGPDFSPRVWILDDRLSSSPPLVIFNCPRDDPLSLSLQWPWTTQTLHEHAWFPKSRYNVPTRILEVCLQMYEPCITDFC